MVHKRALKVQYSVVQSAGALIAVFERADSSPGRHSTDGVDTADERLLFPAYDWPRTLAAKASGA